MRQNQFNVINDFIKAFSCAFSVSKNLGHTLGMDADPLLLRAAAGFGSGVGTMGDTCGAVNSGVMLLGKKYAHLPSPLFFLLCAEYVTQLEKNHGTINCGQMHGGKHLTVNFRRALLTGKTLKCVEILRKATEILQDLDTCAATNDFRFINTDLLQTVASITDYHEQQHFHCCISTMKQIASKTGLQVEQVISCAKGFSGGIGYNGTLCGAIVGGVLCLGLHSDVDLSRQGYNDTLKLVFHGLLKSGLIFEDDKRFLPSRLFRQVKQVYQTIETTFGGPHCTDILGLKLNTRRDGRTYINAKKIIRCREVSSCVADLVCDLITP